MKRSSSGFAGVAWALAFALVTPAFAGGYAYDYEPDGADNEREESLHGYAEAAWGPGAYFCGSAYCASGVIPVSHTADGQGSEDHIWNWSPDNNPEDPPYQRTEWFHVGGTKGVLETRAQGSMSGGWGDAYATLTSEWPPPQVECASSVVLWGTWSDDDYKRKDGRTSQTFTGDCTITVDLTGFVNVSLSAVGGVLQSCCNGRLERMDN